MKTPPARRRQAIRLAAALLLGAALNLVVAWTLTVNGDTAARGVVMSERDALPADWASWLEEPIPLINRTGSTYGRAGWRFSVHGIADPVGALQVTEAGWPLLSFEGKARTVMARSRGVLTFQFVESHGAIPLAIGPSSRFDFAGRLLPLAPRWPGFLVDTLLYAVIGWLLTVGPGKWRRASRARRGLCPACRYPFGDSPSCTECGGPLPRRRGSAP